MFLIMGCYYRLMDANDIDYRMAGFMIPLSQSNEEMKLTTSRGRTIQSNSGVRLLRSHIISFNYLLGP